MKDHRAGRALPTDDQRPGVVAEDRPRHSAKVRERGRDPFTPIVLSLIEKGFDEQAAGIAQDRDEQEHAHPVPGDADSLLPKIDLQLIAWRALNANRRDLGGPACPTNV
jgi:hypothetical protein